MKFAFGYKMRSGKDVSVDYLLSKYGGKKLSFSEPLYDILHYAQNICNFPLEKDREFLQWIGTDWARKKNKNIWVDVAIRKIKQNKEDNIYFSDVRFINEFEALKKNGFVMIKINRNTKISDSHISENDLDNVEDDKWDYIIENNGTLEELYKKIDEIVELNLKTIKQKKFCSMCKDNDCKNICYCSFCGGSGIEDALWDSTWG